MSLTGAHSLSKTGYLVNASGITKRKVTNEVRPRIEPSKQAVHGDGRKKPIHGAWIISTLRQSREALLPVSAYILFSDWSNFTMSSIATKRWQGGNSKWRRRLFRTVRDVSWILFLSLRFVHFTFQSNCCLLLSFCFLSSEIAILNLSTCVENIYPV